MAYDDDELPITSSELYLRDAEHGKKEYQERKAKQAGSFFRFLLNMLKFGISNKGTTAANIAKTERAEAMGDRLRELRAETEKVHGWATKTQKEQETMVNEAEQQPQISADAAIAQDERVQAAQDQGEIERQQQVDG